MEIFDAEYTARGKKRKNIYLKRGLNKLAKECALLDIKNSVDEFNKNRKCFIYFITEYGNYRQGYLKTKFKIEKEHKQLVLVSNYEIKQGLKILSKKI